MLTLITGGMRSGKSALAERLARRHRTVVYVATTVFRDAEMRERIRRHRARRPATWRTVEEGYDLDRVLAAHPRAGCVLVDCLTAHLSNRLLRREDPDRILADLDRTLAAMRRRRTRYIIVTNEVGCAVVPANRLARRFAELAGRANQLAARRADSVWLTVSGMKIRLK